MIFFLTSPAELVHRAYSAGDRLMEQFKFRIVYISVCHFSFFLEDALTLKLLH